MMRSPTTDYRAVRETKAPFTWGKVVKWHDLGERVALLEYTPRKIGADEPLPVSFHIYVDQRCTSASASTLFAAAIYAIAVASLGEPNRARWMAIAANKLLGVQE